jgi:hypothetical protein
MGICAVHPLIIQANHSKQFARLAATLSPCTVAMGVEHFRHLISAPHQGMEACSVLVHERDARASHSPPLLFREQNQLLAAKLDAFCLQVKAVG